MNPTPQDIEKLASLIEESLAHLDLKGDNVQISQTMCIVRDAFTGFAKSEAMSSLQLVNQALARFPQT